MGEYDEFIAETLSKTLVELNKLEYLKRIEIKYLLEEKHSPDEAKEREDEIAKKLGAMDMRRDYPRKDSRHFGSIYDLLKRICDKVAPY